MLSNKVSNDNFVPRNNPIITNSFIPSPPITSFFNIYSMIKVSTNNPPPVNIDPFIASINGIPYPKKFTNNAVMLPIRTNISGIM